jgi:hypothetical protein
MGEILGLGTTHQPSLCAKQLRPGSFTRALEDPGLPEKFRDPASWPAQLRSEWSDDKGQAAGVAHRTALIEQFRRVRQALDEFSPDLVLIWGDDQYERVQEDCVPPFCLVAQDEFVFDPWHHFTTPNFWDEPPDKEFAVPGNRKAVKSLVEGLMDSHFDVSYSYRSDRGLGHAFVNTVLYLDWDRKGFPYPIVPCLVNCYGRMVISSHGYRLPLDADLSSVELDPPSPTPARCFDLGAAIGTVMAQSDLRVALVASSSWSHAFLTRKNLYLYPDSDADVTLYKALSQGNYAAWRNVDRDTVEADGQHEMLNWFCLVGAVDALRLETSHLAYVDSHLFNSNKAFGVFKTPAAAKA